MVRDASLGYLRYLGEANQLTHSSRPGDVLLDVDPLLIAAGGEMRGVNFVVQDSVAPDGGNVRIAARTSVQPDISGQFRIVAVAIALRCTGDLIDEAAWDAIVPELRIGIYVAEPERLGRWPNRTLGSLLS